jgi:hypothetical protein
LALVDLKGSSGSHTNESSKGEGVLHDGGWSEKTLRGGV